MKRTKQMVAVLLALALMLSMLAVVPTASALEIGDTVTLTLGTDITLTDWGFTDDVERTLTSTLDTEKGPNGDYFTIGSAGTSAYIPVYFTYRFTVAEDGIYNFGIYFRAHETGRLQEIEIDGNVLGKLDMAFKTGGTKETKYVTDTGLETTGTVQEVALTAGTHTLTVTAIGLGANVAADHRMPVYAYLLRYVGAISEEATTTYVYGKNVSFQGAWNDTKPDAADNSGASGNGGLGTGTGAYGSSLSITDAAPAWYSYAFDLAEDGYYTFTLNKFRWQVPASGGKNMEISMDGTVIGYVDGSYSWSANSVTLETQPATSNGRSDGTVTPFALEAGSHVITFTAVDNGQAGWRYYWEGFTLNPVDPLEVTVPSALVAPDETSKYDMTWNVDLVDGFHDLFVTFNDTYDVVDHGVIVAASAENLETYGVTLALQDPSVSGAVNPDSGKYYAAKTSFGNAAFSHYAYRRTGVAAGAYRYVLFYVLYEDADGNQYLAASDISSLSAAE